MRIDDKLVSLASSISSIAALIVSVIALYYAHVAFSLKMRAKVRGTFSFASSVSCDDRYLANLTIENVKDRALAIYAIYIMVGNRNYIQIEDLAGNPLILEPFGAYSQSYDPINFYSMNMRTFDLNELIASDKVQRKIVLSTSEGRYVVKEYSRHWLPVLEYFNNNLTGLFTPTRLRHSNGKAYGSNLQYLVEVKVRDNNREVIPIYKGDHNHSPFKLVKLTPEALATPEALELHLLSRLVDEGIEVEEIKAIDLREANPRYFSEYNHERTPVDYHNYFFYTIVGRGLTIFSNWRMHQENKKRSKGWEKK